LLARNLTRGLGKRKERLKMFELIVERGSWIVVADGTE